MKKFTLKRDDHFVAHVWADRVEVPADEYGCFYLYRGDDLVAGIGNSGIQVHLFEEGVPVLPLFDKVKPFMDDFTQADMVQIEVAA